MAKNLAGLADKLAIKIKDNRAEPYWEEDLWDELGWLDLDWKQLDILFGMVVSRWNRAKLLAA